MNRLRLMVSLAAGVTLMALAAPPALAFAQTDRPGAEAASATAAVQDVVNLSPIVVQGQKLPLPIVFQIVKTGLSLPWTNDLNDTRIRCRIQSSAASHFKTLWCEGNRHHILRLNNLHTDMLNGMTGSGGSMPMTNVTMGLATMRTHRIYPGALKALLAKLPPAGSSYTLRVPASDGKPQIDYIVKNGELVQILKYPMAAKPDSN